MKQENFHAALIAGTHSSVGKTTWSLALMALARKKGLAVQPFKAGPDYIDPGFHHQVCFPRRSRNLDLFLLSKEKVKEIYSKHSFDTQLSIVEGVMGLYDGKGVDHEASSAHLAKILGLPVLLVFDGSGMAGGSAAALVLGFQKFDPELNLAGVLVNRVRQVHFNLIKQAVESSTGVACLGFLPHEDEFSIPERHLGLVTAGEAGDWKAKIGRAASFLEKGFNWEGFIQVSSVTSPVDLGQRTFPFDENSSPPPSSSPPRRGRGKGEGVKIGVAYDAAFSFYYEDNLDLLREKAEVVFFSPLQDAVLPEGLSLLYLGGGFPEVYAPQLATNKSMIKSIRDFYASGGFIYGECGGLIYLAEAFCDSSGKEYPLLKLLPGRISMTDRLQNFGYQEIKTHTDTFVFSKNTALRSHEFHYSVWDQEGKSPAAYQLGDRLEGFASERIFVSYQHLHFGSGCGLLNRLFENLEQGKKETETRRLVETNQ